MKYSLYIIPHGLYKTVEFASDCEDLWERLCQIPGFKEIGVELLRGDFWVFTLEYGMSDEGEPLEFMRLYKPEIGVEERDIAEWGVKDFFEWWDCNEKAKSDAN